MRTTEGALWERPTRLAPTGRYLVTGCLITRRSLSGPFEARMLSFCSSCTARRAEGAARVGVSPPRNSSGMAKVSECDAEGAVPMRPQKRLKVLGIRVVGFTLKRTPFAVVTYTACGGQTGRQGVGRGSQRPAHAPGGPPSDRLRALTLPALFSGLSRMVSSAWRRRQGSRR